MRRWALSWGGRAFLFPLVVALAACSAAPGAQNQPALTPPASAEARFADTVFDHAAAAQAKSIPAADPSITATPIQPTETSRPTGTPTANPTETATATTSASATASATAAATTELLVIPEATATATPPPTDSPSPTPSATPPFPTPNAAYSPTLTVPILMYHYISVPPEDADIYRRDLSVTPEQFRAQAAYLAGNGFTAIDLYDLSRAIAGKQRLPEKPVILTFDDGYIDAYRNAFPILEEFGLKGTFFIITEYVDRALPQYMSWEMIEEMSAAGHRMESHSKTHPDLRGAERDELIWQLLGSQETLAAHIGYTPRYFCYPGGRYDETTIEVLRELDFWGAVTTAGGKWHHFDDRFEWSRLRIRDVTTLLEFISLVEPAP